MYGIESEWLFLILLFSHQYLEGTVEYMAPEIFYRFHQDLCSAQYDERVDVWSAGVILLEMVGVNVNLKRPIHDFSLTHAMASVLSFFHSFLVLIIHS